MDGREIAMTVVLGCIVGCTITAGVIWVRVMKEEAEEKRKLKRTLL